MSNPKLKLVLCWHMHQPWYRKGLHGDFRLPWVYLHGIKDYADMAAHLENNPEMRAVVNFTPVLLEQLEDYADQVRGWLEKGIMMADPFLNLLAGASPIPSDHAGRRTLVEACRRAYAPQMIEPYPNFHALSLLYSCEAGEKLSEQQRLQLEYLDEQYFIDLLVWYHITWMGHSVHNSSDQLKYLMKKGRMFNTADRRTLVIVIQETLAGLIPRYRKLSERGQVELSMTPWGHPIVPLLNDFSNLRDTQPDDPMPLSRRYPGGEKSSRWHLETGLEVFEHYFGIKPKGVWLSEGAVSDDGLALLDEMGIEWSASGEAVWRNSCHSSECDPDEVACKRALFKPYKVNDYETRMFFRDDGLSDLIGFEYSKWHADDAVADFIRHIENIADFLGEEADSYAVSVILDGENAWEYYPDNGFHFLDGLYRSLSESAKIEVTTFSPVSAELASEELTTIVAGSWVYGTFSTWMGSHDKNRAWDLLVDAKIAFDEIEAKGLLGKEQLEKARRHLAVCESSDWFWWFGDYNPSDSVRDFDQLYRLQLSRLYEVLGLKPPAELEQPVSIGGGDMANAGTMRRNV